MTCRACRWQLHAPDRDNLQCHYCQPLTHCRVCGWQHTRIEKELISKTGLKTYLIAADRPMSSTEYSKLPANADMSQRKHCGFPRGDFSDHITLCNKCGWKMDLMEPVYQVFYKGASGGTAIKYYHLCCYEVKQ